MTAFKRLPKKRRPYRALRLSPVARDVFEAGLANIAQAQQGRPPEASYYAWQPRQETGKGIVRAPERRVSKAIRKAQECFIAWKEKDGRLLWKMAGDHTDGNTDVQAEIVHQAELRLWRHFTKGGTKVTHAFMRQAAEWAADDVKRGLRKLMILRSAENQEARAHVEYRERQARAWREALERGAQQLQGHEKRVVKLCVLENKSQAAAGEIMGWSQQSISRLLRRAAWRLREIVVKPAEESLRTSTLTRPLVNEWGSMSRRRAPDADGQAGCGRLSASGATGSGPYSKLTVDRASQRFANLFAAGE